jgi:hypothetical protein
LGTGVERAFYLWLLLPSPLEDLVEPERIGDLALLGGDARLLPPAELHLDGAANELAHRFPGLEGGRFPKLHAAPMTAGERRSAAATPFGIRVSVSREA